MKLLQAYKPHYRSNLKLAIPVVISQFGHTLTHMADSVIIGQFAGTIPLAAVSLVNSMFMVIMVVGIGISYGITPLIAQENGRQNYAECGKLLSTSFLISLMAGVILFLICYFGSVLVIGRIGQSPQVVQHARPYLTLLGFSIIPLMIFLTFKQFAEGLGFTKQAMLISIWGNVLNICLGIIFVKGLFGIRPMGTSGVGWSTLTDRCVMAIVMAVYVFRSERFKVYLSAFSTALFSRLRAIKLLKIGTPVAMQYVFEISAFSGAAILTGTIGAVEQASHQVAINLASMTYMMASGLSAAAAIKSGNNFGGNDLAGLRLSAISSYHIVIAFMSITAMLFIAFNRVLPFMYTSDQAVITIAAQLLIIAGFFQLFDGTQVVGLGILRGMGDVNIPTWITFLAYWVLGLPFGYVLGITLNYGVYGIWYGLTLGLLVSSVLLYFRFRHISKRLIRGVSWLAG